MSFAVFGQRAKRAVSQERYHPNQHNLPASVRPSQHAPPASRHKSQRFSAVIKAAQQHVHRTSAGLRPHFRGLCPRKLVQAEAFIRHFPHLPVTHTVGPPVMALCFEHIWSALHSHFDYPATPGMQNIGL